MAPTDGAGQLWAGARCQQILVQGMPSFNTQSNPRQSLMWGEEDLSCRIPGVTGHPLRPALLAACFKACVLRELSVTAGVLAGTVEKRRPPRPVPLQLFFCLVAVAGA